MFFEEIVHGTQYYRSPTPLPEEWEGDISNLADYSLDAFQIRINWRWNERVEGVYDFSDVDELEQRGEICAGFDDEIFLEFKLEQLQELKELAWANADPDVEERHYSILHDRLVARQYAVAEYIRRKILYCNAYPDPVENRYRFIKAAVEGDWR